MKKEKDLSATIHIQVVPRSSRDRLLGGEGGVYKVKVTAPPSEGKANKAVIRLFSKLLGVTKGDVEIVSGGKSRIKTLRIRGLSKEDVERSLL